MIDCVSRRQSEPDSGSTGEFRLIIKDFSLPLISLGHFYVFFIFYLIAAVSCLLIYTHWQGSTEASRDDALYPSIFYPLVSPSPAVLSLPPSGVSPFSGTESSLSTCSLISITTFIWRGCYSHIRLLPCAKTHIHTEGKQNASQTKGVSQLHF